MIGDAFGQLDTGRIGDRTAANFGQRKAGMICRQYQIARQRNFQSAPATNTIHRADHRFVQPAQFLQAAKATHAIIAINRIALCRRF